MPKEKAGRSRGRPVQSEQDLAEMRAHIAACALRLFQEDGYQAVSMRRLASEAGCTVMTLYRYYERKIDILRALWGDVFEELFGLIDQTASEALLSSDTKSPRDRLEAISNAYVSYWLDRREHYFLVFMSSGVSQNDVSVFVGDDQAVARFGVFFDALGLALGGTASEEDLMVKAQLLLCSLNGIAHNLITISAYPWVDPEILVKAAVSGVIDA
ncbi:MAG: TetR/AcrR family transcriptional regulator [Pseudomonadota bacterium]